MCSYSIIDNSFTQIISKENDPQINACTMVDFVYHHFASQIIPLICSEMSRQILMFIFRPDLHGIATATERERVDLYGDYSTNKVSRGVCLTETHNNTNNTILLWFSIIVYICGDYFSDEELIVYFFAIQ